MFGIQSFFNRKTNDEFEEKGDNVTELFKNMDMTKRSDPQLPFALVCIFLLLSQVLFFSCSKKEEPLDRFRSTIEQIIAEIEAQRTDQLQRVLHPQFIDQNGRDSARFLEWVRGHLKRRKDVVVHLLGIAEESPPTTMEDGLVSMELVLSSGNLKLLRKLVSFYGHLVKVRLSVEGEIDWRITEADWQEIDIADLSVQALDAFRALFPSSGG